MSDYISLEAAIKEIKAHVCFDCPFKAYSCTPEKCGTNAALKAISEILPADVRPAVHGEWVYEEPNGANNFKGCYWCDQCHQPIDHKKNFCPNCGADMR